MTQYIVDAFTDKVFHGNPAAVCVISEWLTDEVMISIAKENSLSETAFVVNENGHHHLRWFTPGGEIDLCGHATLATAFALINFYERGAESIVFRTKSGPLTITKSGDLYEMDFPAYRLETIPVTDEMAEAIGTRPSEAWMARDLVCVLPTEQDVRDCIPNIDKVKSLPGLLLHITAQGRDYDSVTRSFAPKLSIPEDPVCGSGHCHTVPLWADKLGLSKLRAYQASERGGSLHCELRGDRVILAGNAVLFAKSEIYI